jgi:hypothetical protein
MGDNVSVFLLFQADECVKVAPVFAQRDRAARRQITDD